MFNNNIPFKRCNFWFGSLELELFTLIRDLLKRERLRNSYLVLIFRIKFDCLAHTRMAEGVQSLKCQVRNRFTYNLFTAGFKNFDQAYIFKKQGGELVCHLHQDMKIPGSNLHKD